MRFRIPFTVSDIDVLRKHSKIFEKLIHPKRNSKLRKYLENSDVKITREAYLGIVYRSFFISLAIFYVVFSTILVVAQAGSPFLYALFPSLLFSFFVSFSQAVYPRVFAMRKQRDLEKNLIPALEDMLVQLNSGIPLFSILINISSEDYGELSSEFKKAVRKINAGFPQIAVLEDLGEKNPSMFFRRALWQISNGMKAGSNIAEVVKDSIRALNEEQLLQIQTFGNKLNPLIMFYMLISVILPALSITFLTILSSLINLPQTITIAMFVGLFVFVVLIQVIFMGVIRSARPSLL